MSNAKADFGKNLRALRRMAGETQTELAESVNLTKSSIAMYELGKRFPSADILKDLAAHFGISVDYLLRVVNLEEVYLAQKEASKEASLELKDYVEALFPLIVDEESEGKETYEKALSIAKDARERFEKYGRVESSRLEKCVILFAKAFKETPEYATCGYIWSIFFLWWTNLFEFYKTMQTEKRSASLLSDFFKEKGEKYQALRKEVMDLQGGTMLEFLNFLRHSSRTSDIGEYFYALWYLLDLADSDLPADINAMVGAQLMKDQYLLNNPYAINLMKSGVFE